MSLHGPITVSKNLQIRLPVKMARALHIHPGDEVFLRASDDDPGALVLLPVEVVERRYAFGAKAELESQALEPPRGGDGLYAPPAGAGS